MDTELRYELLINASNVCYAYLNQGLSLSFIVFPFIFISLFKGIITVVKSVAEFVQKHEDTPRYAHLYSKTLKDDMETYSSNL